VRQLTAAIQASFSKLITQKRLQGKELTIAVFEEIEGRFRAPIARPDMLTISDIVVGHMRDRQSLQGFSRSLGNPNPDRPHHSLSGKTSTHERIP
jgi:hypothetical protein